MKNLRFKGKEIILPKSFIFSALIQPILLFLAIQWISSFYYEEGYEDIWWTVIIFFSIFFFSLYIFLGFFWDKVYDKLNRFILSGIALFIILLLIYCSKLSSIFEVKVFYFDGLSSLFFLASFFHIGFSFVAVMNFFGFFVGYNLRGLLSRSKIDMHNFER